MAKKFYTGVEHRKKEIKATGKDEIKGIIRKMKSNKSPVEHGTTAVNLKYGGEIVGDKLHELIEIT